jgi:hypothetical protein
MEKFAKRVDFSTKAEIALAFSKKLKVWRSKTPNTFITTCSILSQTTFSLRVGVTKQDGCKTTLVYDEM